MFEVPTRIAGRVGKKKPDHWHVIETRSRVEYSAARIVQVLLTWMPCGCGYTMRVATSKNLRAIWKPIILIFKIEKKTRKIILRMKL